VLRFRRYLSFMKVSYRKTFTHLRLSDHDLAVVVLGCLSSKSDTFQPPATKECVASASEMWQTRVTRRLGGHRPDLTAKDRILSRSVGPLALDGRLGYDAVGRGLTQPPLS
jgi:hypothetical protein